jgi:hypothetical protein
MAATSTVSRRGAKAAAAERAAKERRQLYIVIGLGVLLLLVLAYELPKLLGGSSNKSSAPPATTTVPATPSVATATGSSATSAVQHAALRRAMRQSPRDVFSGSVATAPDTLGSVPNPPGLHDPFASGSSPEGAVAPAAPKPPAPAIKGTIVIGKPGAGTVAVHGWIVILASIPTARGEAAAKSFAASAKRAGVGSPSILNSSNRRPLRGGYWVVYTGPFSTLGEVNRNATTVHGRGFTSAYIRQLIVYKQKG